MINLVDIVIFLQSFGKRESKLCVWCLKDKIWRHGSYPRFSGFILNEKKEIIFVLRFKCRNPDCSHFNRTFSTPPFPTFRYIGVSVLFLLMMLSLAWKSVQDILKTSFSHIFRLKTQAKACQRWLSSSNLSDPLLSWPALVNQYSRRFYPKRYLL